MKLGYEWRMDGNFLIRKKCVHCEEVFEVHALQQVRFDDPGYCDACYAVWQMELAYRKEQSK